MKNFFTAFLCITMMLSLAACGNTSTGSSSTSSSGGAVSSTPESSPQTQSEAGISTTAPSDTQVTTSESKTLVVYFSMPETTKADNLTEDEENSVVVIDGEVLGNTQYVAYLIQESTGADIFRIEPKTPYPADHNDLTDFAKQEQNQNARPELAANVENLSQYDTIFIGYPNWWGDMPMLLYTFFDDNDFSGKTIIPFNTHGGSGFSNTIAAIAELEPNAVVNEDGFTVSRNNVQDSKPDVIAWLKGLGY